MNGIVINLDSRKDRLAEFMKQEFPFPVRRFSGITAVKGEDGCTYSHLAVLNIQHEFPFVVFEDDCIMLHPWSMVQQCMAQLPQNWDALWLGGNLTRRLQRYSSNLFRLQGAYCLHAVIYNSPKMVNFILDNNNTPAGKNLDIFYHDRVLPKFNCYITYPMIATQRDSYSDINHTNSNYGLTELLTNYDIQTKDR
jgi:GR25 family glycosyltransferase involved in LPS biosynthesis